MVIVTCSWLSYLYFFALAGAVAALLLVLSAGLLGDREWGNLNRAILVGTHAKVYTPWLAWLHDGGMLVS